MYICYHPTVYFETLGGTWWDFILGMFMLFDDGWLAIGCVVLESWERCAAETSGHQHVDTLSRWASQRPIDAADQNVESNGVPW